MPPAFRLHAPRGTSFRTGFFYLRLLPDVPFSFFKNLLLFLQLIAL